MTDELVHMPNIELSVIDGSKLFCNNLVTRYPQITVIRSLFENFRPEKRFDTIIMSHVLEHVEDPVMSYENASTWLNNGGRIFAGFRTHDPSSGKLQVGTGILKFEEDLGAPCRPYHCELLPSLLRSAA